MNDSFVEQMNKEVNERMKLVNVWSKVDYKELASFSCLSHQMASVGYASPHKLSIDQSRWSYYIDSNLDERVVQSFMLLEILEIKRNKSCWAVCVEGNLGRICFVKLPGQSCSGSPPTLLMGPLWKMERWHRPLVTLALTQGSCMWLEPWEPSQVQASFTQNRLAWAWMFGGQGK